MSERLQHTTSFIREKMSTRYANGIKHKHDKLHRPYRKHARTYPVYVNVCAEENFSENKPSGFVRRSNLRKLFTRLGKGRYH